MMNRATLIRLISGVVVIICIISFYFMMREAGKLQIGSLDVDDSFPSDAPYLSLHINDHGVAGNTIWVNGTVNWIGSVDEWGPSTLHVSMYVYPKVGSPSKSIKVWMWKYMTVLPKESIEDTVEIPILGGKATFYPQSFNFLLSVTVSSP